MKIAHVIPKQDEIKKDILFCEHVDAEFVRHGFGSDIDFIYAGSISVIEEGIRLKNYLNKPLVCWVWDIPYNWRTWGMDEKGMAENAHRDSVNARRAELLKQCDLVLSASEWTKNVLSEQYNIPSRQLYFYIDTAGIDNIWATDNHRKQVIQISRYYYNKRFEDSIEAMKNFPDYELVLMGTGLNSRYGKLLQQAAGNNVTFYEAPSRRQVIEQLKASELLLSPSVFEGWGITPIEAIYCDVVPILSDLDVFKEVYGDIGYYHKRLDVDSLTNAIGMMLGDTHKQQEYLNAIRPVIEDFNPRDFAERWKNAINDRFTNISL